MLLRGIFPSAILPWGKVNGMRSSTQMNQFRTSAAQPQAGASPEAQKTQVTKDCINPTFQLLVWDTQCCCTPLLRGRCFPRMEKAIPQKDSQLGEPRAQTPCWGETAFTNTQPMAKVLTSWTTQHFLRRLESIQSPCQCQILHLDWSKEATLVWTLRTGMVRLTQALHTDGQGPACRAGFLRAHDPKEEWSHTASVADPDTLSCTWSGREALPPATNP